MHLAIVNGFDPYAHEDEVVHFLLEQLGHRRESRQLLQGLGAVVN